MQTRGVHLCTSRLDHCPAPLTQFTDDELMMKETGNTNLLSQFYCKMINKLVDLQKSISLRHKIHKRHQ